MRDNSKRASIPQGAYIQKDLLDIYDVVKKIDSINKVIPKFNNGRRLLPIIVQGLRKVTRPIQSAFITINVWILIAEIERIVDVIIRYNRRTRYKFLLNHFYFAKLDQNYPIYYLPNNSFKLSNIVAIISNRFITKPMSWIGDVLKLIKDSPKQIEKIQIENMSPQNIHQFLILIPSIVIFDLWSSCLALPMRIRTIEITKGKIIKMKLRLQLSTNMVFRLTGANLLIDGFEPVKLIAQPQLKQSPFSEQKTGDSLSTDRRERQVIWKIVISYKAIILPFTKPIMKTIKAIADNPTLILYTMLDSLYVYGEQQSRDRLFLYLSKVAVVVALLSELNGALFVKSQPITSLLPFTFQKQLQDTINAPKVLSQYADVILTCSLLFWYIVLCQFTVLYTYRLAGQN